MIVPQKPPLWISILLMLAGAVVGWHIGGCARSAHAAPLAEAQPAPDATTLSRAYVEQHAPNKPPAALPTDPFQLTALRVLAGHYGNVEAWRYDWYSRGLRDGVKCRGTAYLTSYGTWESPISDGLWAADGLPDGGRRRLDDDMCSADPGLPFGSIVWCAGSLRVVRDRGSHVQVCYARRRGDKHNDRNLDFWTQTRDEFYSKCAQYAVVRWGE